MFDKDRASKGLRSFLAERAGEVIKNILSGPPEMTETTLIITCQFKGEHAAIEKAAEEGARRAQTESSNSRMAKVLFTVLRVMGFGRINTTGKGSVETIETKPGTCEVKVVLGVEVENHEKLVAASESLNQKIGKIPQKLIYKMLGVDPNKLNLESVHIQIGNALPWTEQSDEGYICEG